MRLSDNERKMLEAIRDNDFRTIAEATKFCGFHRAQGFHYVRSLALGGLIDGFEVTYAGMKMLSGEELVDSDDFTHVDIRVSEASQHKQDQ